MRISFFTLGCRVNHYETQQLEDLARARGFNVVPFGSEAELCVVNSCALTALAQTKVKRAVKSFVVKNPNSDVLMTGCFAQADSEAASKIPGVKWVFGNPEKMSVVDFLAGEFAGNLGAPILSTPLGDRMNLKIQDGCDNFCSYCIIPRLRGLPRSEDFNLIVDKAAEFADRGVREVIVSGINTAKFSSPKGGIVELLDALDSIDGLLRIRMGSIEPTPDLPIDAILERAGDSSHKLMPHLHISAQSLCDKVLSAMRRKYSAGDYLRLISKAFEMCPEISLGTDIICGHPGEGDAEFAETFNRVKESPLAYLHVFTFSPRPKTLAAGMDGIPPKDIRARRASKLRELGDRIFGDFIRRNACVEHEVLLESPVNGVYMGYTQNYIKAAVKISKPGLKNTLVKVRFARIPDDIPTEPVQAVPAADFPG